MKEDPFGRGPKDPDYMGKRGMGFRVKTQYEVRIDELSRDGNKAELQSQKVDKTSHIGTGLRRGDAQDMANKLNQQYRPSFFGRLLGRKVAEVVEDKSN
jgi:hypothetical protein